jgi:LysM repeat protein
MRGRSGQWRVVRCLTLVALASSALSGWFIGSASAFGDVTHEAAPGQSLADIAIEHGVSVNVIAAANDLPPETTFSDVTALVVPGEGDNPALPNDIAPRAYIVEAGDTIEKIAASLGVSVADLVEVNGLDDPDVLQIGQRLYFTLSVAAPAASDERLASVFVENIPAYKQARSLSCEYASVFIATWAFGTPISEEEYIAVTPITENPHFGYRGNIDGEWGRTDDYGIYAEALVPMLESHGFVGEVSYGADPAILRAHLDLGHPVITWIATRPDTGFYEIDQFGNSFKLVPWEHVVVVYGYNEVGVFISDPGTAALTSMDWGSFVDAWLVLDGMALAVYPA